MAKGRESADAGSGTNKVLITNTTHRLKANEDLSW